MANPEPEEFDFGSKKKSKKKSSDKKKSTEDEVEEKALRNFEVFYGLPRGSATVDQVSSSSAGISGWAKTSWNQAEWERGALYTYDELLGRLYEIIEAKNPNLGSVKKYMLKPPTTVRVGSKKVGWVNFQEICDMMKRPTDHVMQFVLAEFGTEGSITENGQLILKGRYLPKHLESLLRKYIREFVTCEMCKSANTKLVRDSSTRLHMVACDNCNASRTATSIRSGYHSVTRADRRAAKQAKA